MDIKQNIICIKTATKMGSGIIYSSELAGNELGQSHFIIFTNKHLVEDLPKNDDKLILTVDFDIYDKNGLKIEIPKKGNRVKLQLFYVENEKSEDIATFLLTFSYKVEINLERKVLLNDNNLSDIYIEGFPEVLQNDEISSKIQLRGIYKPIFPINHKVGIFQIKDDYHWYSNYKDLRLFQGFSGGPIYKTERQENFIIGMSCSISNIADGENPFKLVYYYKLRFILEYLREQGCIIFKKNKNQSITIRWIYNINIQDSRKNINLLLLGASGAGKSSFTKTFLLHSHLIDATNDGQTTRSNIIYNTSLLEKKPRAIIQFLTKEQFRQRMEQINYSNYLMKLMSLIYIDAKANNLEEYLKYYYESFKTAQKPEELKNEIFDILLKTRSLSYSEQEDYKESVYGVVLQIIEHHMKEVSKSRTDTNDEKDKLKKTIEAFIIDNEGELQKVLSSVEGFYYESEFDFLDEIDSANTHNLDTPDTNIIEIDYENFSRYFSTYYESYHNKIMTKLIGQNLVSYKNYSKEISFDSKELISKWLPLCLQVKGNRSLTGMIDYVYIYDKICNDYAFIIDDLEIATLQLVDTFGLDHANWDQEKGEILSNIVYSLTEKGLIHFNADLAVVYIKKLDSGKPTELKSILPQIYNIIPQSPVYCVFNGVDIFFDLKLDEIYPFDYLYTLENVPKAIKYLVSDKGKTDILSSIDGRESFKENLYHTLKNNIITFCSNSKVIDEYYNIYNSNIEEIYKLLLSICMNESSSMNIIPTSFLGELKEKKFDQKIDEMIESIFKNSTKNWSGAHWKTMCANYDRINYNKQLGYWGTYQHQWNQLFHKGYVNTVSKSQMQLLTGDDKYKYEKYIPAIESCVKNMEENFLGQPNELISMKLEQYNITKHKFRELIENMYKIGKEKNVYKYDPFINENACAASGLEFLNDVCDFSKGYILIKDELREHFKDCLSNIIKEENMAKSENLLKLNQEFYIQLKKLKYDFDKKYDDVDFGDLMINSFKNTEEKF